MSHPEIHRSHRVEWLRAAVLGANDGIVSTASLTIGALRVTFGGALAMALTAGVGLLFGVVALWGETPAKKRFK